MNRFEDFFLKITKKHESSEKMSKNYLFLDKYAIIFVTFNLTTRG